MNKLKNSSIDLVLAILLIVLILLLVNPLNLIMQTMLEMILLGAVIVLLVVFMVFICKEKSQDEREEYHKIVSGKIAYLTGVAILSLAFTFQALNHEFDLWIPLALSAMVISKLFAKYILNKYK